MLITSIELYKVNKELARSIQQSPWLYSFFIGLFCIGIISGIIIDLLEGSTDLNTFIAIAYYVVLTDIVAVIVRISNRAFIEPYQLIAFPLSKWKKFLFHCAILLLDTKTLIYMSSVVCYIFFFIQHSSYTGALLSILVWFLLLTNVLTWTAVFHTLFAKYLDKMGDKIHYIGIFVFILIVMQDFIDNFMFKIPVIKHAGTALYGLWTNNPQIVWGNLSILIGSLSLPLILLFGVSRVEWNQ